MKILITGSQGVVGNALTKVLQDRGHQLYLTDQAHCELPPTLYMRADVANEHQIARAVIMFQPDLVYHLAAEFGRWNGESFTEQLWRSNVIGTKNMIRLQQSQMFKMVFFSSSEVYGDWTDVMSEDVMDKYEIKQLNDYAMTKWVGEQQCINSATEYDTETVRVRLFNLYGPGEFYTPWRSVNCRFCYSTINNHPITVYKGHWRTSTYIEDAVRTIANIADNFKPGMVYNIGSAQGHDIETLADLAIKHSGANRDLINYKESEPMTTKIKKPDITRAIKDLDHQDTVSLDEGVKNTIEWMRAVYD